MASYNRIILMGNLTRDPEISYTPGGMAIAKFGFATNERVKNQSDEWVDRPCFVDITVFGRQAETANQYLRKGSSALIEGKLRYETWEAKDGGKRSKHVVIADRVQFVGSKPDGGSPSGGASAPSAPAPTPPPPAPSAPPMPEAADDEDLPF